MKKVILSAAALMIGAIGFAQVTGAPEAQQAYQIPGSPADANVSETHQTGHDQRVKVFQVGKRNSALGNQANGSGSGSNQAIISQTGPSFLGYNLARDNEAEANQRGTENQSSIRQSGKLNDARSDQGMSDQGSRENRVLITQGVSNGPLTISYDNYAFARQNGDENQARIKQDDDHNDAWTDQTGDENRVLVEQSSSPLPHFANEGQLAKVVQVGDENQSRVKQKGKGARNYAYTTQLGDENRASQYQYATSIFSGWGNTATINQGSPSFDADAFQTQIGAKNSALITQTGGSKKGSNHGEQYQKGIDNSATMTQHHNGKGGDNFGKQKQEGKYNTAFLSQKGMNNKAQQNQDGDDNWVYSTQQGNGNLLNTWQMGDDNYAFTSQQGHANAGLVVQYDGQSAWMTQHGNGNQANIFQAGPYGGAEIECEFDDPLVFDPIPEVPEISIADVCPECP